MELGTKLRHKGGVLRAIETMKVSFHVGELQFTAEQAKNEVMCESKYGLEIYEQVLDRAIEEVNKALGR